ncbi:putative dehydrogenase [Agromyces flavus]|uniref:Dehydrogenase n=1 Tax=Agromyces flavus TaxID=589382 RepID=A0A1H1VKH6_9MICO|nr:Gfo/Idh/MocA family oxidoreductase [Agromyces flavus]MCP2365949.1 putative dehydrogenase [Agromyces flavus]GGI43701.1 oxidoreductase [Agromyces flavus]SDS84861.1 Predicted dehydrogenase [Agromyces flavus]
MDPAGHAAHSPSDTAGPLRAAIIGTGAIANAHAKAIAATPNAELVAVVDRDDDAAGRFAELWGGPAGPAVVSSLDALLATRAADVLHICTPPGVHAEQAIAALDAGVHVICEKPVARSLGELDAMTEAAAKSDRRLAVVFQQRTGTAAAHVRELLESGALGRPLVATCETLWYRDPAYFAVAGRGDWAAEGGGPTLSLGINQIDLLAWLLGDWASVHGRLWRLSRETETEDVSTATVEFRNGVVASVTTSALSPREISAIRIDTELATVTVDHLYGHGHEHWRITPAPHVHESVAARWALPEVEEASGHEPLVRDIYRALVAGGPLPPTATDPARSFEIVTAIYSSAATGRTVTPEALRDDADRLRSLESPITDLRR